MTLYQNATKIDAVYTGGTLATAVYLGVEKVWPIYVANESPWYNPGGATGSTGYTTIEVPWPAGADFCDVIAISGGAGGTGTGIAGNAPRGGGEGVWRGCTIARVRTDPNIPLVKILLTVDARAGYDGVGGGNFNTDAADGSQIEIGYASASNQTTSVTEYTVNGGLDKTSNTNNRNGGNVAETFTFNGRTYTLASYGVNAGRGGATSNKNGGPGNRPGGGGQSATDGGLTGYEGGAGAHGAVKLYWYAAPITPNPTPPPPTTGPAFHAVSGLPATTNATTWTIPHTTTVAGTYVVLATGAYQSEVPTAATYGGVPMTKIGQKITSSRGGVSFWGLANAPAGTNNCVVTGSNASITMAVSSYTGVTASRVGGVGVYANSATVGPSMVETCTSTEMIVQAFGFCYVPTASRPHPNPTGGTNYYNAMGSQYSGLTLNRGQGTVTFASAPSSYGINGYAIILS